LHALFFCSGTEKEARKWQKTFGDLQRDALVKTGADFIAECVSFTKGMKEERP